MTEPLPPELEAKAVALASRIREQSADLALELARELVTTTDATLFGATEFTLRDKALKLVGIAYREHVGQKKTATSGRRSTARTAAERPVSTTTGAAR